ncbi:MAG TPA: SpoIIE family protein phosphatase [Gaiellaceae bacterium]
MVVEGRRLPYDLLARATKRLAAGAELSEACELLAGAVAAGAGAKLAVVWVLDEPSGGFVARAAAPAENPRAAEVAGSRRSFDDLVAANPPDTVVVPATVGRRTVAAIELLVDGDGLDRTGETVAELAAAQLGLVLQARGGELPRPRTASDVDARLRALEAAGETLAAGAEARRAAKRAVELAAAATDARAAAIWRVGADGLEPLAFQGEWPAAAVERGRALAEDARAARRLRLVEQDPGDGSCVVSIPLGQPPFAVLQLRRAEDLERSELSALASFAASASHALRLGERAQAVEADLERTRALLSVVSEAIARLSLAHTLEIAVERSGDLLGIDRVAVYLREDGRLRTAAGRDLDAAHGHEQIASCLLELATGPLRARETIEVRRSSREPVLAPVVQALVDAGAEAALAVPLRAAGEAIGLLVAYPRERRSTEAERTLLSALAAQLAVAVQNARLHEQAKELGEALASVLASERQAARQLGALYEISSSFARSLSLGTTLATVASSIVRVLEVDAAAISVPDERGDQLVPQAVHVPDGRLAEAVRTILDRPSPSPGNLEEPLVLDVATVRRLGGAHVLLLPFLEKGSTAALLPIATHDETLAVLTIVSLDPASPISAGTIATATSIATQTALAIDNARLYQQQKAFAETIQRALLPRHRPRVRGLELGTVYESAARVDVGGDLYDFLELDDGRLAVVLGDVTGHGVDATADMAMAKFVFRSLVREHPCPVEFLAHANEVIAEEVELGKFVTMTYVVLDPGGTVSCASAGHPAPRVVYPDGRVEPLGARGLALGIDPGQQYAESGATLPPGGSVVLYTDGVTEARSVSRRDLYGDERLDALLREHRDRPAQELAEAILADCRAFAGGELADDCAIVVARRT